MGAQEIDDTQDSGSAHLVIRFDSTTIEDLLKHLNDVPEEIRGDVRDSAAGMPIMSCFGRSLVRRMVQPRKGPLLHGKSPLLACENRRPEYLKAWWN